MIFDLTQLVLLGVLCAALHWLVARSEIFRPFWSRARGMFAKLLACPACSGFWLGTLAGALDVAVPIPVISDVTYAGMFGHVAQSVVTGLLAVFVTPVFEGLLVWGLEMSALAPEEDGVSTRVSNTDAVITPVDSPRRTS